MRATLITPGDYRPDDPDQPDCGAQLTAALDPPPAPETEPETPTPTPAESTEARPPRRNPQTTTPTEDQQ